jgi:hypothetical protein
LALSSAIPSKLKSNLSEFFKGLLRKEESNMEYIRNVSYGKFVFSMQKMDGDGRPQAVTAWTSLKHIHRVQFLVH